jgi:hypothetical protein
MTHTRRDSLRTATATAVLTATLPVQAKETPATSNANFADVNGQHIFYSVHGAGKPLILLHGGINPDSFGSNLKPGDRRDVLCSKFQKNGGDDETRTRDLCRDSLGINVFSATYVLSGGCQVAERDYRNRSLWVNLWVRILAFAAILGIGSV